MKAFSHVLGVALGAAALPASAAIFTVSNTNDSGDGSLRQAILSANATAGADEIHFAIPGDGVHTIAVHTGLPGITDGVVIDGYTQAGTTVNDTVLGTDAVLLIEVTPAVSFSFGGFDFLVGSAGSTLRGIAVYGFNGSQIELSPGCTDCVIAGNFIGTDASGTIGFPGAPGTRVGIAAGGARSRIGGVLADRNLVSGLSLTAIGVGCDGCVVQNNLVGTDRTGNIALGSIDGIVIGARGSGAVPTGVLIGGAGAGNVIGGNSGSGIDVLSGSGHAITANQIGLGAGSLATVPNGGDGILVEGGDLSNIGSDGAGLGNKIFVNGGAGIRIPGTDASAPQGWFLIRNEIVGNAGLGIDLGAVGSTPNDTDDADVGANSLQNFPILGPVTVDASGTTVHGALHSTPDAVFRIDFYGTACGGNGTPYLGVVPAVTDLDGNAEFDFFVPVAQASAFVTAAASRSEDLATSELAPCVGGGDGIFADGFDTPPPPQAAFRGLSVRRGTRASPRRSADPRAPWQQWP